MSHIPRVVIAAPASGAGKTTVATGLTAALCRRGATVAPFKVGPDYIDPGYHALAAGRPGRNLDPVLVGAERIGPLFVHGALGADIAVIEGVLGLYDGRSGTAGFGSTAHVARLLDAPVLLVVDARGQGRSVAALLHGFRGYEPGVRIAGVVLNRVGSAQHERVLGEACADVGLPVLGVLGRTDVVGLPSRHLGLVPAAEHGVAARRAVDAMAELISQSVDLDEVARLAASAPPITSTPWEPGSVVAVDRPPTPVAHSESGCPQAAVERAAAPRATGRLARGRPPGRVGVWPSSNEPVVAVAGDGPIAGDAPVVAVAGGAAFTFGYAEHAELLAAAGARVAVFDPLRDEALPDGTAAMILPGGFPEQHAEQLSANTSLRAAVAHFVGSGGVVHAECGGLLYLVDELDGWPMCGVLKAKAAMDSRLALGYREAVAATDSVLFRAGERVTGHEFHRTQLVAADRAPAWHWRDNSGANVAEGFVLGRVHASYLHTHPAGHPEAVGRLVSAVGGAH